MRSNNDDKHLVENMENEAVVLFVVEASAFRLPKTFNK